MNHKNFGSSCANCIGTGVIRGPGEYRCICPVCDGLGRMALGHPTQDFLKRQNIKEKGAPK